MKSHLVKPWTPEQINPPKDAPPPEGGRKNDDGKPPMSLISSELLEGVARVLAFGAEKYEPWNWAKGMGWSRPYSAAMRHLLAWNRGENVDPETGLSHLAHASTNLMFLLTYQARQIGTDDRHVWPK